MRSVQLPNTLHVRVSLELQAELEAAAERDGISAGEIVRRAVRAELDAADGKRFDPYVSLPFDDVRAILDRVMKPRGEPEALQDAVNAIGDELVDLLDVGIATLDAFHSEEGDHSLLRAAGLLQQGSEHLLRAAYGVRALRARSFMASANLEPIEARLGGEAA